MRHIKASAVVIVAFMIIAPLLEGVPSPVKGGSGGDDSAIDALVWSTYLGGSAAEYPWGICVDDEGHTYIAGSTGSADFPTTPGAFMPSYFGEHDVFVCKLSPDGSSLVYSTYIATEGESEAFDLALDAEGNAYITGFTSSREFPTTPGAFQTELRVGSPLCEGDGFVCKLSADGTELIYSTYLGGSDWDFGESIAVDGDGNAYVAGLTNSSNFPTSEGAYQGSFGGGEYDAFVCKLGPRGEGLGYSTYLGGSELDYAEDITLDGTGRACVVGVTNSTDFPITPGAFGNASELSIDNADAFVVKVSPDGGSLDYSTCIGGSRFDGLNGIAVDGEGHACVVGETESPDLPVTQGAFDAEFNNPGKNRFDVFACKLVPDGSGLAFCTYLGGERQDRTLSVALDRWGHLFIAGDTGSEDFPTTHGAIQSSLEGGLNNVFLCVLGNRGDRLEYSTLLGGYDYHWTHGLAIDGSGDVFMMGSVDEGNFPTTHGCLQSEIAGDRDGFVCKLSVGRLGPLADPGPDRTVHQHAEVVLDGSGSSDDDAIANWTWTFTCGGERVTLVGPTPRFVFDETGYYNVTLTVTDTDGDQDADTVLLHVVPPPDDGADGGPRAPAPAGLLSLIIVLALAAALSAVYVLRRRGA